MRKKSKFAERWQGMDALQKREWYTNVLNIVVKGGKKNKDWKSTRLNSSHSGSF